MNTGVRQEAIDDNAYAARLVEVGKIADTIKQLATSQQIKEIETVISGVDTATMALVKSLLPNIGL